MLFSISEDQTALGFMPWPRLYQARTRFTSSTHAEENMACYILTWFATLKGGIGSDKKLVLKTTEQTEQTWRWSFGSIFRSGFFFRRLIFFRSQSHPYVFLVFMSPNKNLGCQTERNGLCTSPIRRSKPCNPQTPIWITSWCNVAWSR
jgi:hypothetical protein